MTKARYRYKRYRLYLPISIGDAVDTSIEYEVRLVDKLIVITPKRGDLASTIAQIENDWQKSQRDSAQAAEAADTENDAEP